MNMTSNVKATDREVYAAYVTDEATQQILISIAAQRGWNPDMIFTGGIASAVRSLGAMACPEFLIVDLSDSSDPRADVQSLADVAEEGTVVLAIGDVNDVTLYRDLIQAGVYDYLVKPLTADLLQEAINAAEEALMAPAEIDEPATEGNNRQIVCVGVRGGLGTSSIITNLGWLMAEKKRTDSNPRSRPVFWHICTAI